MSLRAVLDNKDVRARFSQEFIKPKFSLKKGILAQPVTKHYALVGTAFDYLMRFYIRRINPKAMVREWVAELSLKELQRDLINNNQLSMAEKMLCEAKEAYSDYIKSGIMNRGIARCTLLLAQLDIYFRAGIIGKDFGTVDDGDVDDLLNLICLVNPDSFRAKELCILNPTFGKASQLVGGADADFVIDNLLVDIKTTKKLEFKIEHFNELVGYYILYKIDGMPDVPVEPKIKKLGIYYSRYAELYTFPVAMIIEENKFAPFKEWFKEKATQLSKELKGLRESLNQT
jgi:hypothetical protein